MEPDPIEPTNGADVQPDDPAQDVDQNPGPEFDSEVIDQ